MANEHFERKLSERLSIADINRSLDALASGTTKESLLQTVEVFLIIYRYL
jgi:hypothetical protein